MLITLYRSMSWKAGQHVYLTIPALSLRSPLEAHPFSIATIPDSFDSESAINNDRKTLRFIVRVRNGFTRRLMDSVKIAGVRATPMPMSFTLIDGPYGIPPKVEAFKNVILVAGIVKKIEKYCLRFLNF